MNERLPRGVEALLRYGLPADQREPIAGDLLEDYVERSGPRRNGARARRVWTQAARLAWRFVWERSVARPAVAADCR
jgi:hypothetical protein